MPNCKVHEECDLVCPWDSDYCHTESHEEQWMHVSSHRYRPIHEMRALGLLPDDMPEDREAYYNERAERMP